MNSKESKENIYYENNDKSGIYLWLCHLNEKYYIGSAKNLKSRLYAYFSQKSLIENDYIIQRALIKHGHENFSLYILEYCDIKDLITREQYYIDTLTPQYNILKIAGSSLGYKHTSETILKLKVPKSEEFKEKMRKPKTEAHIAIMKEAQESKKVYVYSLNSENSFYFFIEFSSYTNAASHFNCTRPTIHNNIDTNKLFKDKFLLSSYIFDKIPTLESIG